MLNKKKYEASWGQENFWLFQIADNPAPELDFSYFTCDHTTGQAASGYSTPRPPQMVLHSAFVSPDYLDLWVAFVILELIAFLTLF